MPIWVPILAGALTLAGELLKKRPEWGTEAHEMRRIRDILRESPEMALSMQQQAVSDIGNSANLSRYKLAGDPLATAMLDTDIATKTAMAKTDISRKMSDYVESLNQNLTSLQSIINAKKQAKNEMIAGYFYKPLLSALFAYASGMPVAVPTPTIQTPKQQANVNSYRNYGGWYPYA